MKIISCFIVFLLNPYITSELRAQGGDDFWKQTNGPYGAFALSLTCDQMGGIYVGTMMQGLYKSTDDGFSWSGIGISGKTINTVLAYTNNIIFAGTDEGLYQTSDGGNNWTKNETITGVNSLYKTQNGFILSGTQYTIFRSTDMGITWENTMGNSLDVNVKALHSDATGKLYSAAGNKGVYVSTNDGLSWSLSNNGLPLTGNSVNIIFAKDSQNVFVYLSSENNSNPESGVYISTNQGLNWTQTSSTLKKLSQFSVNKNGELLAGKFNDDGTGGVYYSQDLGSTWYRYPNQPGNLDVRALLVTPTGHILSGNYYSGLFLSTDNGNLWQQVNTGINNSDISEVYSTPSGSIFCSRFSLDYSHGGVYRSLDEGNSWDKLNIDSEDTNVRTFYSDKQGNLYAGEWVIHRSTNNGDDWQVVSQGGAGLFSCIKQTPNGTLIAGSTDSGIFRSTDNGLTWAESNSGLTWLTIFSLAVSNNGTIFAGSYEGSIFRSTNEGMDWEAVNTDQEHTITALYKRTDNLIFAGSYVSMMKSALYKSSDDGITWIPDSAFINNSIIDIAGNESNNDVFVACPYKGVYRLSNNESTWTLLSNEGLSDLRLQTINVSHSGYLYAGTWRGSLFRSIQITTNVTDINTYPAGFSLTQNYPNPFNPVTKIRYSIPNASYVAIKIFDMLGNEIETLVKEDKPAGTYELNWNAENLSSGVYFYRLQAGDFVSTKKMILMK